MKCNLVILCDRLLFALVYWNILFHRDWATEIVVMLDNHLKGKKMNLSTLQKCYWWEWTTSVKRSSILLNVKLLRTHKPLKLSRKWKFQQTRKQNTSGIEMLIHKDTQSMNYKDWKTEYTNLMWGNNKVDNKDSKKRYTRTSYKKYYATRTDLEI